jgi:hypothetical protein
MREVVKKEVIKLLDAGIIYPVPHSEWVSPVHCVPKKGGLTVVNNEKNKLIPQRTVTGWRMCIVTVSLTKRRRKITSPYRSLTRCSRDWQTTLIFAFSMGTRGS